MNKKLIGIVLAMLLFATFPSVAVTANNDEWPIAYHDNQHTGFSSSGGPETNNIIWSPPGAFGSNSPPIVINEKVFVATSLSNIVVFNALNGEMLNLINSLSKTTLTATTDKLFAASNNGLTCYDIENYDEIWNISFEFGEINGKYMPHVSDDKLYQAFVNEIGITEIVCVDTISGSFVWDNPINLGALLRSDIVIDDMYLYCTIDKSLLCFDLLTGSLQWQTVIISSPTDQFNRAIPTIFDHFLYTITGEGFVYKLDINDEGAIDWIFETGDALGFKITSPTVAYGNVYAGTKSELYCLNISNPEPPLWTYNSDDKPALHPIVADNKVYLSQNGIRCLNAHTGELIWESAIYDESLCPAIAYDILFFAAENTLYAFHNNSAPDLPIIDGPSEGIQGEELTFTISTDDIDSDELVYRILWDDGTQNLIGPLPANEPFEISHSWDAVGTYDMRVFAEDWHKSQSDIAYHSIDIGINHPPSNPLIEGPTELLPGDEGTYTISSTDPEGLNLTYEVNWGDGGEETFGPYASGEPFEASHTWDGNNSLYSLIVVVTDEYGAQSVGTLIINMKTLQISSISGGNGIDIKIENIGNSPLTDVIWNLSIEGGFIILTPTEYNGTESSLLVGGSIDIHIPVLGIGLGIITPLPQIIVQTSCAENKTDNFTGYARIILFRVTFEESE